jgi:hypothetical protein
MAYVRCIAPRKGDATPAARRFIRNTEYEKRQFHPTITTYSVVIKYIKQYNTNTHYLSNWNAAPNGKNYPREVFAQIWPRAHSLGAQISSERHTGAQKQRSEAQCRRPTRHSPRESTKNTPRLLKWAQRVYVWSMKCPYSYLCLSCTIPIYTFLLFCAMPTDEM